MAVYTHVSASELEAYLAQYDIGDLVAHDGIESGVENTNYRLRTSTGDYILTLFEKRVAPADLPYFLRVMDHFAAAGAPTPTPMAQRNGAVLGELRCRPSVIISFLPGAPDMTPGPSRARAFGATLADLHNAARTFPLDRPNALSLAGWRDLAAACRRAPGGPDALDPGLDALLEEELRFLTDAWPQGLPAGLIHADLFPDNVFFESDAVRGIIDFYFSCTDFYAYDLAICLNAWCSAASCRAPTEALRDAPDRGALLEDNLAALMEGYLSQRSLNPEERAALPTLFRGAAIRFLLTRLFDWLNQVDGAVVKVKDPLEFRDLLLWARANPLKV